MSTHLEEFELLSMRREPAVPTKRELSRLRVGDAVKLAVRPTHRHFYWDCLHTWFLVEELPTASHAGVARAAGGFQDSPIRAGQSVSFGLHHVAAIGNQHGSDK